jgi:hypothetical protein
MKLLERGQKIFNDDTLGGFGVHISQKTKSFIVKSRVFNVFDAAAEFDYREVRDIHARHASEETDREPEHTAFSDTHRAFGGARGPRIFLSRVDRTFSEPH